jgi:hypothetical protein
MVAIFVVNSSFPLTLTYERSNVVFKSILFCFISSQSLSLHIKIVIKLQKNYKSVDMLKYQFHFKHLESRPELHFSDLTSFGNIKHELILTLTLLIDNQMII